MTLQRKYDYVICLQRSLKGNKGIFIWKSSYKQGCMILLKNTDVKRSHQQRQKIWRFLKDPLAPVCKLPALPSSGNLPQTLSPGPVPSSGLPKLHPLALIIWWCHCSLLARQLPHWALCTLGSGTESYQPLHSHHSSWDLSLARFSLNTTCQTTSTQSICSFGIGIIALHYWGL